MARGRRKVSTKSLNMKIEQQKEMLECKFCSNGTPILKTAVHPF